MATFPASAVVPTVDRPEVLARTLTSLKSQDWYPEELIVIDASADSRTRQVVAAFAEPLRATGCRAIWQPALIRGAAAQRNQGVALAAQSVIWFFDDDILFEPCCVERLWSALRDDPALGGVNAMITNQRYQPPRAASRIMFRTMAGCARDSYAGLLFGPGINLLPEDRLDLPDVVPVEWLNTTCTLYRRKALPSPPFAEFFTGYSMMEDVTLSANVGRKWKLANARTARIYHDSQSGGFKSNAAALARMELVNRHYVMTRVLGRRRLGDYVKLAIWEMFQLGTCALRERVGREFWLTLKGKCLGTSAIASGLSKDSLP